MKKLVAVVFLFFMQQCIVAQQQQDLYATAKNLMKDGDYENACLVLHKLLTNEPNNIAAQKDYAFAAYYKKDYKKSIELNQQLIKENNADDQAYQLLSLNYKAQGNVKEYESNNRLGINKCSNKGFFYNELGEFFFIQKSTDSAIAYWEKGIKTDPNFADNYYNAAIYYTKYNQPFWAIIYGEIFTNIESYTIRTAEIKERLVDAYKKILYQSNIINETKNSFAKTVLTAIGNSNEQLSVNMLTAVRTKFLLNWFNEKSNANFPYTLFNHLHYLTQEGLFEAYNQWLFGVALNPIQYKLWVDTHKEEANAFKQLQENKIFKLVVGEYYGN